MSLECYHQQYTNIPFRADLSINAPLAKPIETVQKTIEDSVDTIIGDKNKNKKHKKRTAIAAGSTVLVISALVALLNPKFSPKFVEKLKKISEKAYTNADKNKHDAFLNRFYSSCKNTTDWTLRSVQFISNFNSAKDIAFKWFCTEKKNFFNVHNKSTRRVLKNVDAGVRKVLKKPYEAITNCFDFISKKTVLSKYSYSSKKMDSLEELIVAHKGKLNEAQKQELLLKLEEISKARGYFSESATVERFKTQEESMKNLERDFISRYNSYINGFSNKWQDKRQLIDKNLSFWAEEILKPVQTKVETNGNEAVFKLFGDGKGKPGIYQEVVDILSPHLSLEEKQLLQKSLNSAFKSLSKANKSECIDYFGKKRDLVLGSAPTDILSALIGLVMSGIFITTADNKDQRISRLLTGVFPVIGGLAVSMIFTAQLVSGPIGIAAGVVISLIPNKIGSFTNKQILGNKEVIDA